ncbi:MAG: hypothetical protein A2033_07040 [Bacteroidetes bacterium GWA2_31_9]|nr:MAG: hypothetical protein A2033_07040 [Bacteroidetes bacterium GWA2_31_9]
MRKFLLLISITFLTFSMLKAQNLLVNGNFEAWTGNVPDSWTTIETGIIVGQSTDTVHGGTSAMRANCITTSQGSTDFRQTINVSTGLTYNISVWFYHIDTTLQVTLYAGAFTNLYSDNLVVNGWQELTYSYTASTTGGVEFGLRFYDQPGFATSSIVYVDDFSITQAVSLSPVISNITTNPTVPTSSDAVNISASITDTDGTISSAYLYWSANNITFDSIAMNNTTGSTYTTASTIPAQVLGTIVYYYIKATDNSSNLTTSATYSYNLSRLASGDVAIVQYRYDAEDGFSFVVLKSFTDSVKIKFTDNAWGGSSLATNESTITWTAPATGINAGTVVTIQNNTGVDVGTVSGTFSGLSTTGDNIFAFTGDVSNPTFIFGLSTLPWLTTGAVNTNNSYLPSNLTNGVNAIAFSTENDNGFYNVTPISGATSTILASICNESNWLFDDDGITNPFQLSSFWSITVGKNMISNTQNTSIYPIPSNDKIFIDNINGCDKIVVSNIIGQPVANIKVDSKFNNEINIENYKNGVYIIQLYKNNKTVLTKRIIKN